MTPPHRYPTDFDKTPFLVIWEVTRACALACVHCRPDSIPHRDPRELTTEEGLGLIDQVRALGDPAPLFVLTGGDPMRRPDLATLVQRVADVGLTVALTPSGTAAATRTRLTELKHAGLSRVAGSLDGPTPDAPDAFRRVRGSYDWTMRIIESAIALDLPLQINSTVSRITLPHLHGMAQRMLELPIALWAVFFLVQMGRGASLDHVTADECERTPDALEGRCGACEFRTTCGGSRSCAFAATGSAMGPDPLCAYVPAGIASEPAAALGPRTIPLIAV